MPLSSLTPERTAKEFLVRPAIGTAVGVAACVLAVLVDQVWLFWVGLVVAAVACGWLVGHALVSPRRWLAQRLVGLCVAVAVVAVGTWSIGLPPKGAAGTTHAPPDTTTERSNGVLGRIGDDLIVENGAEVSRVGSVATGTTRWSTALPAGFADGDVTRVSDRVVAIQAGNRVTTYDASTGRRRWTAPARLLGDLATGPRGRELVVMSGPRVAVVRDAMTGAVVRRFVRPESEGTSSEDWFGTMPRFIAGSSLVECTYDACDGEPLARSGKRWERRLPFGTSFDPTTWGQQPRSGRLVANWSDEVGHPSKVEVLDVATARLTPVAVPDGWTAWSVDPTDRAVLLRKGDTVAVWWPGTDPVAVDGAIRSAHDGEDGVGWLVGTPGTHDFAVAHVEHDLLGRPWSIVVVGHDGHQKSYRYGYEVRVELDENMVAVEDDGPRGDQTVAGHLVDRPDAYPTRYLAFG